MEIPDDTRDVLTLFEVSAVVKTSARCIQRGLVGLVAFEAADQHQKPRSPASERCVFIPLSSFSVPSPNTQQPAVNAQLNRMQIIKSRVHSVS